MYCLAMECLFSFQFFAQIWRYQPAQLLVLPAPAGRQSWVQSPRPHQIIVATSMRELASAYGIPVLFMAQWDDLLGQMPAGESLLTACFPRRVPLGVLARGQCYNIHPALLPKLRGADPLFYVARGDAPAGVTIHHMDAQFDTGLIIAQQLIDITRCVNEADLIRLHAQVAATNWLALAAPLPTGTPQPQIGTNAPLPQATDYVLYGSWLRQRTQRFMQLTNLRRHPYWVPALRQWVSALHPFGAVQIPCADGYLQADAIAAPSGVVMPLV